MYEMDVYIKCVLSVCYANSVVLFLLGVQCCCRFCCCCNYWARCQLYQQHLYTARVCAYSSLQSTQITLLYCFKNLWFYVIVCMRMCVHTHINDVLQQSNKKWIMYVYFSMNWYLNGYLNRVRNWNLNILRLCTLFACCTVYTYYG